MTDQKQPDRPQRVQVDPDDQAWMGTCALLLLTGVSAALIALVSDFNDTRWLYNGTTHMVGLVLTVGILMWGMSHLRGRMKQRMQAAVLVSLFLHLAFGFYIHLAASVPIVAAGDGEAMEEPESDDAAPVTLPDYTPGVAEDGAMPEAFEQPLETVTPESLPDATDRQTVDAPSSVASRSLPRPEPTATVEPAAIELNRDEPAVPRRGSEMTDLDLRRQPLSPPDLLQDVIPLPQAPAQAAANPAVAEPGVAAERQGASVALDQPGPLPALPGSSATPEALAMTRRQAERQPELQPGQAAALARQRGRAAEPELAPLDVPEVEQAVVQGRGGPQPGPTEIAKSGGGTPSAPQAGSIGRDLPSGIELPQLASGVRRRSGVSSLPSGVGSNTGAASSFPRSIAGSDLSRIASQADPVPSAAAGSSGSGAATGTGPFEASAGTTVRRGGAQAPIGPLAGPAGDGSDVGPAAIVSNLNRSGAIGGTGGRGAGGGEPGSFGQSATGRIGRSSLAEPGIPSGLAEEIGPVPIAASGAPGGGAGSPNGVPGGLGTGGGVSGSGRGGAGTGRGASVGSPAGAVAGAGRGGSGVGGLPGQQLAASAGAAGLGAGTLPGPGIVSRRARPEGDILEPQAGRFVLPRGGSGQGPEGRIDGRAPFGQRDPEQREQVATARGGSAGSERSVELGLAFLVRHQSAAGNWSLHAFNAGRPGYTNAGLARMQADTAATGLALLSFLGAGYTHLDGKYQPVVGRGVDFLLRNQKPDGDLFTGGSRYAWLYSHGIAAIALCEAYGMTRDPQLREPAQRAIDFIVAAQSPTEGGWRYAPRQGTDTSVSGWQLMALKSGELAGLNVPPTCYAGVSRWLDVAQGQGNGSLYAYRPASEQPHQRDPSAAMTAEGLLMRLYISGEKSDPVVLEGAEYLRLRLPQFGSPSRPQRDTYYWYYATQTLFQVQGDAWNAWNEQLRGLLVGSQVQTGTLAGSWDPLLPVPDRWGADGGRIYVTAMHLLNLEVYYRHLPLYRSAPGVASRGTSPP